MPLHSSPSSAKSSEGSANAIGEELEESYRRRFSSVEDYRIKIWRILVKDYFQEKVDEGSSVLDLGSGWAEFINTIEAGQKFAMDMNPESKMRVSDDVTFLLQNCSESWQIPDESVDTIFTSNFFEHLPTKEHLVRTLDQGFRCLKRGGRILCLGPNIRYVGSAYWDFFDHYLPLSHHSLKEVLELSGFTVETVIDRFLPYTMAQGITPPPIALQIYLKFPFLWRFFGKQFLIVASKPQ